MRFSVGTSSWHFHNFWEVFERHAVEVPVCVACRPRFRLARTIRVLTLLGIAVAAGWGAFQLNKAFEWHLSHHLLIFLAIPLAAPGLILCGLRPLAFDMTASSKDVDYEFRDPEYAHEFARMNGGTIEP